MAIKGKWSLRERRLLLFALVLVSAFALALTVGTARNEAQDRLWRVDLAKFKELDARPAGQSRAGDAVRVRMLAEGWAASAGFPEEGAPNLLSYARQNGDAGLVEDFRAPRDFYVISDYTVEPPQQLGDGTWSAVIAYRVLYRKDFGGRFVEQIGEDRGYRVTAEKRGGRFVITRAPYLLMTPNDPFETAD